MKIVLIILFNCLLTILVEEIVGYIFFGQRADENFYKVVLYNNVLTNLILNYCLLIFNHYYFFVLIVGEILVVLIENYIYGYCLNAGFKKYLLFTILANVASYAFGLLGGKLWIG